MDENNPVQTKSRRRIRLPQGRRLVVLLIVVLIAGVGFLGYKYSEAQNELNKKANPQEASKTEAEALAREVGENFELPTDETPSVATVVDASKLKSQPFFAKSENNDKVLIYTKARKAYLYRPGTKKLVEVATLDIRTTASPTPGR